MKVQPQHRFLLNKLILESLQSKGYCPRTWVAYYQENKIGKDHNRRARWDALWATDDEKRHTLMRLIYADGCDDTHIDTVLRAIFKGA